MSVVDYYRKLVRFSAIPLFIAAAICPSWAVDMHVDVGFNGCAKGGKWTPIFVKLSNDSSQNIKGTLQISKPANSFPGNSRLPTCSSNVELPSNSSKVYTFYVRPSEYDGSFTMQLADGNHILVSRQTRAVTVPATDTMVVSIGGKVSALSFLNGEAFKLPQPSPGSPGGSSGTAESTIRVGSIEPTLLPDRSSAYAGADVIVMSEPPTSSMNPDALQAIAMWTASGGTLVIPTGPNYRNYQNDFCNDLLPVTITGAANLPSGAALSAGGSSPFPAGPVAVSKSVVRPGIGQVLVAQNGIPLVAARTYGVGRVIFLAMDCSSAPFRNWNGQVDFWKDIAASANGQSLVASVPTGWNSYSGTATNNLSSVVQQSPAVRLPSFLTIGVFLLIYITALVPINCAVLRKKRRPEYAWISTPAIVLIFALGAYGIGYTMKGGKLKLVEATVVEASNGVRYGYSVTDATLFSPSRRSYDVSTADPRALFQTASMNGDDQPSNAVISNRIGIDDVPMAMWSSKTFESVSGTDLGGTLDCDLVRDGTHITGEIRNNTGTAMHKCAVVCAGHVVEIGDMGKGASKSVNLSLSGANTCPLGSSQNDLEASLRIYIMNTAKTGQEPILIGMSDDTSPIIEVSPKSNAERSKLLVFHLDCRVGKR